VREVSHAPRSSAGNGEAPPQHERAAGDRREERERAYALNPDQPLAPKASNGAAADAPSHLASHTARHAPHKARPVPALLMKRPAMEPEKV
jgi:hypothetical protein